MTKILQTRTIDEIANAIMDKSGLDKSQANPLARFSRSLAGEISVVEAKQNDGVSKTLLKMATGEALDEIAYTYYSDIHNQPITRKENESDDDYRVRLRASRKGYAIGTIDAYTFYSASSHPLLSMKNTLAYSPSPMDIHVGFIVQQDKIDEVTQAINAYMVDYTASGDRLTPVPATVNEFDIDADVYIKTGSIIDRNAVIANIKKQCATCERIGGDVSEYDILRTAGEGISTIKRIVLNNWTDVQCSGNSFPQLKQIRVHVHEEF